MSFVPAPHVLEILLPSETTADRFGNERPGGGEWEEARVAQWWVDRTEEKGDDSILRTVDYLHAHVPSSVAIEPGAKIRTPDGEKWEVQGNPEDFSHGFHRWDPGLRVIHAINVRG